MNAARTSITVNSVPEYQWTAALRFPAPGSYCARVFLGGVDLLGTDPSLNLRTQTPAGSTAPFSFAVFGDWGQVDSNGNNPDQANLMQQIASSGVNFAVTVGDNGYPSGSQTNYGDLQQKGANISSIFGPSFWAVPGRSVPLFASSGNHGITSTTASRSTEQVNWPETTAAATSGGKYVQETYCCVNGTASSTYPSSWYAFDVGTARFYVLQADWADGNPGNATVYANDYAAHWSPNSAEYQWLAADLAAHPSGLKFAFFHYPLYSDQKAQNSDTFLQGPNSLEGLLARNNVSIAFNGHAHIYERNAPTGPGTFPSYVTGGGGATLQPVAEAGCSAFDAYAIGWSPTKSKGSRCGAAPVPDSASRVFHFLKVSVNGSTVTVTPTDELGRTFDVQSYTFSTLPDTVIDSAPADRSNSSSATFAFHATQTGASFSCALDGVPAGPCQSPVTYSGLADGTHTFTVNASTSAGGDPMPASDTWQIDTVPPTAPSGLTASAPSPALVNLSWNASFDANGVAGYTIKRNAQVIATIAGTATSYADTTVSPATSYLYQVFAQDTAGNTSSGSVTGITTPGSSPPVFADGFDSGNLNAWTSKAGLTIESTQVHSGSFAAEANTVNGNTYAKKTLPSTYADAYSAIWINVKSTSSQVNLLRYRAADGTSIGYVYITATGQLGLHNDTTGTNTTSSTIVTPGSGWHELELHMAVASASSVVQVWLDGVAVSALSFTTNLGTAPVGQFQIGDVQTGRTYDVIYDDAAFGTQRVGP